MKRILLVDDDFHLRRSLELGLRNLGYSVTSAEDATEALELIQENIFDVVVTDVLMPGPSGFELAEQVRAMKPQLPVILMTAIDPRLSNGYRGVVEPAWFSAPEEVTFDKTINRKFPPPLLMKPFVLSELVNLFEPLAEA